jgi:hypothetical protein
MKGLKHIIFNGLTVLSLLLRRVSAISAVCAGVLFFVIWAALMTRAVVEISAGGKPYDLNPGSGRYYVKQHARITEVGEVVYKGLLLINTVDTWVGSSCGPLPFQTLPLPAAA